MNATFIKALVVTLFAALINHAYATLIMACTGSSSSCGGLCAALGGGQSPIGYGANGDLWLCNAAIAQPGNSNPIASFNPTSEIAPATRGTPRCAAVRRDFVNKPGLPPVAINKASNIDLIKVPGVNASSAQKIIAERGIREFSDWDDVLQRVDSMRCIDFTGSPLQVMSRAYNPRGGEPKFPGF